MVCLRGKFGQTCEIVCYCDNRTSCDAYSQTPHGCHRIRHTQTDCQITCDTSHDAHYKVTQACGETMCNVPTTCQTADSYCIHKALPAEAGRHGSYVLYIIGIVTLLFCATVAGFVYLKKRNMTLKHAWTQLLNRVTGKKTNDDSGNDIESSSKNRTVGKYDVNANKSDAPRAHSTESERSIAIIDKEHVERHDVRLADIIKQRESENTASRIQEPSNDNYYHHYDVIDDPGDEKSVRKNGGRGRKMKKTDEDSQMTEITTTHKRRRSSSSSGKKGERTIEEEDEETRTETVAKSGRSRRSRGSRRQREDVTEMDDETKTDKVPKSSRSRKSSRASRRKNAEVENDDETQTEKVPKSGRSRRSPGRRQSGEEK